MLKRIIDEITKKEQFSFENIIENNSMTDDDFFQFLEYVYVKNIPEVRTSLDGKDFIVLENENYYLEEKEIIKTYLEDIREKNKELTENSELIDKYLKIAVRESILYSKYGFTFLDLVQEATLGVISAINYYDEIVKITVKDIEFFIKNFAIKYILEYQKSMLRDIKSSELSYILYLKLKIDKEMGHTVEEISKQMNVTVDYISQLEKIFDDIEVGELVPSEEILKKADRVTKIYILENIPKKLSYIDEQILIMTYGLDDRIYTEKEIAKNLNISLHNVGILREKALNKLAIDLLKNEFTQNTEENEYFS